MNLSFSLKKISEPTSKYSKFKSLLKTPKDTFETLFFAHLAQNCGFFHFMCKNSINFNDLSKKYPHLDENTIFMWNQAFLMFDSNQNGCITARDLGRMFIRMGQKPTNVELRDIVNELDVDQDGTIQFEEFIEYFHGKLAKSDELVRDEEEANLKAAFKVFDIDSNGEIDVQRRK